MYSAAKFIQLKNEIDKELARRCNTSDGIASTAGKTPFESAPALGKRIRIEHVNKLTGPIQNINTAGIPGNVAEGERLFDIAPIETKLNELKAKPVSAASSNTGCATRCAGLCASSCFQSCQGSCGRGCSSGCEWGCDNGCSGDCSNGCTGCGNNCSTQCSGICDDTCYTTCYGSSGSGQNGCYNCDWECYSNCNGCYGCSGGCGNQCEGCGGCSGGCENACSGCQGCSGSCSNKCTLTCTATCKSYAQ